MYRYSVDNAVTYASEDLVLFKESPFACWMERLTLENPDHGIPPNANTSPPADSMERQDDLADTLRAEGKQVVLVEWELAEPQRRAETLEAMRLGADFIVNGQLALGSLSGSANLLMRTSGYSDLGNYLYVPCNTQRKMNLHSALRLCFLADLLHSLQGQLPPQMLIIRGGSDVVPLQTEDHIYHYRAVKQRFMAEQQAFRKHRMPDPAESSHFGRWADCANEVIKQRALRSEQTSDLVEPADQLTVYEQARPAAVGTAYDLDEVNDVGRGRSLAPGPGAHGVSGTLVEQARHLAHTGNPPSEARHTDVDTLQNLSFIGSSSQAPTIGEHPGQAPEAKLSSRPSAPAPQLPPAGDHKRAEYPHQQVFVDRRRVSDARFVQVESPREEASARPELAQAGFVAQKAHPLDSPGFQRATPATLERDVDRDSSGREDAPSPVLSGGPDGDTFNDSLMTSSDIDAD
jgi:hypothetical protein